MREELDRKGERPAIEVDATSLVYPLREMPNLQTFRSTLTSAPHLEQKELMWFVGFPSANATIRSAISVDYIIGGQGTESWDLTDRHFGGNPAEQYVYNMAAKFNSGEWRIAVPTREHFRSGYAVIEGPRLVEFFGLCAIEANGNHRVAAHKGLDIRNLSIPAFVTEYQLPLMLWGHDNRTELLARRDAGYWQGEFNISENIGTAYGFDGPWVFSRDMERSKMLYETLRPDLYSFR